MRASFYSNNMNNRVTILVLLLLFAGVAPAFGQPKQGMPADEIALPNVQGDTIRLSGLKGKVVLIDFWASWCGPCRMANRDMVKLYSKYKDKGFEIFSISVDDNAEAWKKAMKKDHITWLQVRDGGGWQAKTARAWNIEALPTTFLMNKDGLLLAMDLEGKQLEHALKELLGNE